MLNNAAATRTEILSVIDTIEGMLRIKWDANLLAERTKWIAVLCRMEGR